MVHISYVYCTSCGPKPQQLIFQGYQFCDREQIYSASIYRKSIVNQILLVSLRAATNAQNVHNNKFLYVYDRELTPIEEASRLNQKLKANYEARLARLTPGQATQKTSLVSLEKLNASLY